MCAHRPPCPPADRPDRKAARTVAFHPEQGWSLLCNGVIVFDDMGEILPNGGENTITYHVPISRAGAVQVQLWLEHLGTTSVVYGFRILSDDGTVVHAEGRRVQVRLDPATLRPAPIGAELREACRPLLARGEGDAREVALIPTGARQPGTHRQPTGEHPAASSCPRTRHNLLLLLQPLIPLPARRGLALTLLRRVMRFSQRLSVDHLVLE